MKFVLLDHIKSLYTSTENHIKRPWLWRWFHHSLEDGTVSAVAERSISFWWYNVLRSPCETDLLYFFSFFNRQLIFPGHCISGCDSHRCPNVKFILQKWSATDLVFIVHKTLAIIRLYMGHFILILCNVWAEIYKFHMRWPSISIYTCEF